MEVEEVLKDGKVVADRLLARILREGIYEGWRGREWLLRELRHAYLVETSEAFDYYQVGTPPEGDSFDIDVFPNVGLPFEPPIFFEGRLAEPVLFSDGEVPELRMGALLTGAESLAAGNLAWIAENFPGAVDLTVVSTFYEAPPEDIVGPQVIWVIPVGEDGRVLRHPTGGVPLLTPFRKRFRLSRADEEHAHNLVSLSHLYADQLHMTLFALCCVNAVSGALSGALSDTTNEVSKTYVQDERGLHAPAGSLANVSIPAIHRGRRLEGLRRKMKLIGPRSILRQLSVEPLLAKLDRHGNARTMGLGHALTVCRDEFNAPTAGRKDLE